MSWTGFEATPSDPPEVRPMSIEPPPVDDRTEAEIQAHVKSAIERVGHGHSTTPGPPNEAAAHPAPA